MFDPYDHYAACCVALRKPYLSSHRVFVLLKMIVSMQLPGCMNQVVTIKRKQVVLLIL